VGRTRGDARRRATQGTPRLSTARSSRRHSWGGGHGPLHSNETVDRSCRAHHELVALLTLDWLKEVRQTGSTAQNQTSRGTGVLRVSSNMRRLQLHPSRASPAASEAPSCTAPHHTPQAPPPRALLRRPRFWWQARPTCCSAVVTASLVRRNPHSGHRGFSPGHWWGRGAVLLFVGDGDFCRVGASWAEKTHRHRRPSWAPCTDRPVEGDQRFALRSVVESRGERTRTRYRACKAFQIQMANDPIAFPRLIQLVSVALPALQSRRHQAPRATFSPSRGSSGERGWGSSAGRSEYPWKRPGSGWTQPRNEHPGMHWPSRWRQPRGRPTTPLSARASAIEHELPATLPTRRCRTRFSGCASTPRTAGSIAARYPQRVRRRVGRCAVLRQPPKPAQVSRSYRGLPG